jgi:hypothetical protein
MVPGAGCCAAANSTSDALGAAAAAAIGFSTPCYCALEPCEDLGPWEPANALDAAKVSCIDLAASNLCGVTFEAVWAGAPPPPGFSGFVRQACPLSCGACQPAPSSSKLTPLYPTPLYMRRTRLAKRGDVNAHDELSAHELRRLRELSLFLEATSAGVAKSNQGGWHSKGNILHRHEPIVGRLATVISAAAREYCLWQLRASGRAHSTVRASLDVFAWANVNYAGHHLNRPHAHNASEVTGVLFVDTKDAPGLLRLHQSRRGAYRSKRQQQQQQPMLRAGGATVGGARARAFDVWDAEASRIEDIHPTEGMLLLFPGWMWHEVLSHASDAPRITYSFNIALSRPDDPVKCCERARFHFQGSSQNARLANGISNVLPLWPTPLWRFELPGDHDRFSAGLLPMGTVGEKGGAQLPSRIAESVEAEAARAVSAVMDRGAGEWRCSIESVHWMLDALEESAFRDWSSSTVAASNAAVDLCGLVLLSGDGALLSLDDPRSVHVPLLANDAFETEPWRPFESRLHGGSGFLIGCGASATHRLTPLGRNDSSARDVGAFRLRVGCSPQGSPAGAQADAASIASASDSRPEATARVEVHADGSFDAGGGVHAPREAPSPSSPLAPGTGMSQSETDAAIVRVMLPWCAAVLSAGPHRHISDSGMPIDEAQCPPHAAYMETASPVINLGLTKSGSSSLHVALLWSGLKAECSKWVGASVRGDEVAEFVVSGASSDGRHPLHQMLRGCPILSDNPIWLLSGLLLRDLPHARFVLSGFGLGRSADDLEAGCTRWAQSSSDFWACRSEPYALDALHTCWAGTRSFDATIFQRRCVEHYRDVIRTARDLGRPLLLLPTEWNDSAKWDALDEFLGTDPVVVGQRRNQHGGGFPHVRSISRKRGCDLAEALRSQREADGGRKWNPAFRGLFAPG